MKKSYLLFFVAVIFCSCFPSRWHFSDADNWIPGNFHPSKNILLIEEFPYRKANEAMIKFLSEKYPGQYEVLDKTTILSKKGKYADTVKYQFAFLWKKETTFKANGFNDVDPYGSFYDLYNNRAYPTTHKINNYGDRSYIPFFNSIIKHFEK